MKVQHEEDLEDAQRKFQSIIAQANIEKQYLQQAVDRLNKDINIPNESEKEVKVLRIEVRQLKAELKDSLEKERKCHT